MCRLPDIGGWHGCFVDGREALSGFGDRSGVSARARGGSALASSGDVAVVGRDGDGGSLARDGVRGALDREADPPLEWRRPCRAWRPAAWQRRSGAGVGRGRPGGAGGPVGRRAAGWRFVERAQGGGVDERTAGLSGLCQTGDCLSASAGVQPAASAAAARALGHATRARGVQKNSAAQWRRRAGKPAGARSRCGPSTSTGSG